MFLIGYVRISSNEKLASEPSWTSKQEWKTESKLMSEVVYIFFLNQFVSILEDVSFDLEGCEFVTIKIIDNIPGCNWLQVTSLQGHPVFHIPFFGVPFQDALFPGFQKLVGDEPLRFSGMVLCHWLSRRRFLSWKTTNNMKFQVRRSYSHWYFSDFSKLSEFNLN